MKRKIAFITLFSLYIAAILYLCLMKPDDMPQIEITFFGIPVDKLGHFLMFMPFPVLSYLIFNDRERNAAGEFMLMTGVVALGIAMAFATEQLQALTQYRTSDINDVYSDMIGLAFGCIITTIVIIIKKRHKTRK